ncbi:MAG TPA: 2Fe-2S iron-sulfur cluster-binding protein [Acidimicrobiia bacterium]|nr:2Fe-2S iron-sulfur cluster-binding protein [Acidimicrobiia bacterium]
MTPYRLDHRRGEVIDRSRDLTFEWNGATYHALDGDTIASALAAGGERVFSRSYKYHRPRGILTATYHDPNLMVQVGDDPNVRAGHRRVEEGMEVDPQNAWPSLDFDVKASNRLVGRFLSPGFYYKTFMAPKPLWPAYQRVLSRFANGGRVNPKTEPGRFDHRHAHPDVLVAGGGPSGMAAAIAAAEAGASVILVEEEASLGGHLRYGNDQDLAVLADLVEQVQSNAAIEVMADAVVTGRFDHNWVSVVQRSVPGVTERLVKARVKCLVVAVGTLERPYVFKGNDLPGVILSTAVRRLINLFAVRPGDRAVVLTANESGDAAVTDLEAAGVEVVTVIDARAGEGVHEAAGSKEVASVLDSRGRRFEADLLVTATGWTTPTALTDMSGGRNLYVPEAARFIPGGLPEEVMATGGIVGDGSTEQLIAHGTATGSEAARRALAVRAFLQDNTPAASKVDAPKTRPRAIPDLTPGPHPAMFRASTHGFVDFSEDVTSKDLISAAKEGYDSIELAKRYTTVGMGPIQGKLEAVNALAIHGEATGIGLDEGQTTTWRPPYAPIRLGTLAGRKYEPVRYSPMQPWHEAHGAVPLVAGQWIRPDHYGDPAAEVRAVRQRVGIIDVSPIGKIDLRGREVPRLLELVYVNRWAGLDIGKVRYGVMCAEDGVILDDGVVGRLGEDHYMMSTTSGGAGTVWNWLDDWLQTGHAEWDVSMTAVSDGYASINVAGPRARDLLGRVTDIDLDPDAFHYMEVRTGTVAEVEDCFVWRIGFTGELSFEIHIPSRHGLEVWEALLEAGGDLGVRPFGVEAQRILRLEKGHFIVGQDTDGLSQGFGFGLDRAIRLDKDDFVGKPELAWQAERGDHPRLVALQTEDPDLVPLEACQIVDGDGVIRGRITSSRMSPTLNRSICLAQLDSEHAEPGRTVAIRLPNGRTARAKVLADHAHFDPEGGRARG